MSQSSMSTERNWIDQAADQIEANVLTTKGKGSKIVCASGISPSGPIHLGNLREVLTVHLVVEELRSRGRFVEHIHSWDDYDRLRKIPQGIPSNFSEYVGMPLSAIPDPFNVHESYAEHYKNEFVDCLEKLGVFPRYISQTKAYLSGAYKTQIKLAMSRRREIFDVLAKYQTLNAEEKVTNERREEYFPFKIYCENCHRDTTKITRYDDSTSIADYSCAYCKHQDSFSLETKTSGKLVWKVDWPMRWSFENVDFEPGGEDHSAPGSSFTVGKEVVSRIFGWQAPFYIGYSFVGMGGRSKISSSSGTTATPRVALEIFEPAILRWLYVRRNASQSFNVDFGKEVLRIYDEWDALAKSVESGKADILQNKIYMRSTQTSTKAVAKTTVLLSFKFLSSIADVTQGNRPQILRIVADHHDVEITETDLEPRLSYAIKWATAYQPEDERTIIRSSFAQDVYENLSEEHRKSIHVLTSNLKDYWNLGGLSKLVYGVPKIVRGMSIDDPPTEEIKTAQRSFFASLYALLCNSDTGPKLPTLLLSLGLERVLSLLQPQ